MANISDAFNKYPETNKSIYDGYMNKLINKIDNDSNDNISYKNSLNNKFTNIDNAFDRVKISNDKYDNIIRHNKSIYGYICTVCNGPIGFHLSIQNKNPHQFIRGSYRKLTCTEQGPYSNGISLVDI